MKYYSYHPVTKIFVSEGSADESPLEPGVFLFPAHSTLVEPVDFQEDEFLVFDELKNIWNIVKEEKIEEVVEEAEKMQFVLMTKEEADEILEKKKDVLRRLGVSEEEIREFFI